MEGLEILKQYVNINCLADLTIEQFEENKNKIENEVVRRRVEHVVTETKRTLQSAEAMKNGDLVTLGKYITDSHNSLRDLYEVTGFELDSIVDLAHKQEGVLGARMVGAGFGGCAISLVQVDLVDKFIENVGIGYKDKTNLVAEFYVANIGNGVVEEKI